ncbi:MAG TPA: GAF domain-containing sensor histidine kinase [Candidatus Dormibacteraeota bacterium]
MAERWLRAFVPLIHAMSESLADLSTLEGAARFVAAHGAQLIPRTQCAVSVVRRRDPTTFVVIAGAGGSWAEGLPGSEWPVEGTLHGRVMLTGAPVETDNAQEDTDLPWVFAPGAIRRGRVVPLRTDTPLPDTRVGMGAIGFWRVDDVPFTDDDRLLMDIFGRLAAVTIQSSEAVHMAETMIERASSSSEQVRLLHEAADALSSTVEMEHIYRETVSSAARIMTTRRGKPMRSALLMVHNGVARLVSEYDATGARAARQEYRLGDHTLIRRVVDERATVMCDIRDQTIDPGTRDRLEQLGLVWSAMAPVESEERVIGILRISSRDQQPFSEQQRETLEAIADVAAMAIGNVDRYRMAHHEAQRLAELENVKSEFLRLASHELRGPLALVRGYLSMFDDGSLPVVEGQARGVLPVMTAKLEQMTRMVDDMLETARLEDRRMHLSKRPIDLRDVVHHTIDDFSVHTGVHSLVVEICAEPLPLQGDAGRLATIIRNLLDNAIRYSPSGCRIAVTVRRDGDAGEVAVSDQGMGIAAEDMERLFERFGRIVTPENSHIAGTGLGLHLSRELARLHGGDITAESSEGSGSTFRLRLPLARP